MASRTGEQLHEQLHKVPGVPPQSEAARLNANAHAKQAHGHPRRPSANQAQRNTNPPRVLVAWQEWIGRLFHKSA